MAVHAYIELKTACEQQMQLSVCNGCDACWLRCAHDVPASRDEWETLQSHIAALSPAELQRLEAVLAQDKTVDLGDDVTVQMCRYFNMPTHRCAVYPARPLVCRLLGHVEWMPCPIEKVPRPIETADALELMRAYAEQERHTFTEWELHKREEGTAKHAK